jgi:hypothetical protein
MDFKISVWGDYQDFAVDGQFATGASTADGHPQTH